MNDCIKWMYMIKIIKSVFPVPSDQLCYSWNHTIIFIAIALDETSILFAVYFSMQNI